MPAAPETANALSLLLIALFLDAAVAWLPGVRAILGAPAAAMRAAAGWFERRLDRRKRGAATRRARGLAVALFLGLVGGAVGWTLATFAVPTPAGRAVELAALLGLVWQRLALEDPAPDAAAADSHAVARGAVERRAAALCRGVVGVTFWYLLLGLVGFGLAGVFAYRAVGETAARFGRRSEFGYGATRLDAAFAAIAAPLAGALIALAAVFVPRCSPGAALAAMARTPSAPAEAAMAGALGLALGGPPGPWIGDGRARAEAADVKRATWLFAVACLIHAGLIALAAAALARA